MDTKSRPVAIVAAEAALRMRKSVYPEPYAALMDKRFNRPLGDLFGLSNFGVNLARIAPGGMSALRHAHTKEDEFIFVLEVGDRTPGDAATYPDVDLRCELAEDGHWRFTRKDGTPC
jgi:uncharacterized cupin superfamily protein